MMRYEDDAVLLADLENNLWKHLTFVITTKYNVSVSTTIPSQ